MRAHPRNPRSIRPEPDEPELKREEWQVVQLARHELRNTIDRFAPPRSNKLSLVAVAVVGLFADLMAGLPAAPDLAEVVNKQIERAGWRLVQVPRN